MVIAQGNAHSLKSMKLQEINLPVFSGSYTEWLSFKQMFEEMVLKNDKLGDSLNMIYLKRSLTGKAEKLIQNYFLTLDGLSLSWVTLKKRYDNKRRLLEELFSDFVKISPAQPMAHSKSVRTHVDVSSDSQVPSVLFLPRRWQLFSLSQHLTR